MSLFQQFRLGNDIESLALRMDSNGTPFSQMIDIQDIFPGALRFKVNGIGILFLENEQGQRYEPKRIAYYPDAIIDIISALPSLDPPPYIPINGTVPSTALTLPVHISSTSQTVAQHPLPLPHIATVTSYHSRQQKMSEVIRERSEPIWTNDRMLFKEKDKIGRPIVSKKRMDAFLSQPYKLDDYPFPRLFVILPDSLTTISTTGFRLHFLCNCGGHCNSSMSSGQLAIPAAAAATIPITKYVHLTNHNGYELSMLNEFLERFGPYVRGMLQILRRSLTVDAAAALDIITASNAVMDVKDEVKATSESTLHAVNMMISFLEETLDANAATNGGARSGAGTQEVANPLKNLAAPEAADLRRLGSFSPNKNADQSLGNLYITTETGHVKWVCFDHYRQIYRETAMASFLQFVESNDGTFGAQVGKITISLKSSLAAKDFFTRLSTQGQAVISLKVSLDWPFSSADLAILVDRVSQSNIHDFELDLQEYTGAVPLFAIMRPGKGQYHPLLGLFSNNKIESLVFSNVALIGPRTSSLPTSTRPWNLQCLHYSGIIYNSDEARLVQIISYCPQLVELRLGCIEHWSQELVRLDRAISSLHKLKILHRYYLHSKPSLIGPFDLNSGPHGSVALRELVELDLSYPLGPTGLLEDVIRRSSSTLEVLVLFAGSNTGALDLVHLHSSLLHLPKDHPFPFYRLSHLELMVNMASTTQELMETVLPSLSLIHLGVNESTCRLLRYVSLTTLQSLRLSNAEGTDLESFYNRVLASSTSCQIQSLRVGQTSHYQGLLRLLGVAPLRRLFLFNTGGIDINESLQRMNLSRLKVLTVYDDNYSWRSEAILTARSGELTEGFLLQLPHKNKGDMRDVHDVNSRGLVGSPTRLARHRVSITSFSTIDKDYYTSITPSSSR